MTDQELSSATREAGERAFRILESSPRAGDAAAYVLGRLYEVFDPVRQEYARRLADDRQRKKNLDSFKAAAAGAGGPSQP